MLVSLMLASGILLGCIPLISFMIANVLLGTVGIPTNLLLVTFLIIIVVSFLLSAGCFALLQYNSCKKVHNVKQIFANAGITAGIQFITILFIYLTGFTSIPKNMLPLWIPYHLREGLGYGYFTFFAQMFGTVIGGTLSAIC